MHTAEDVIQALQQISSPDADSHRFFYDGLGKTKVIGVGIGKAFPIAKKHRLMSLAEIEKLLDSPYYEVRMAAAAIMDFQAREKKAPNSLDELYDLYIRRHDRLDNWDFMDRAAPHVVGQYLSDKPRDPLYELARSSDPWQRRTAIVATYWFIKNGETEDTFQICDILASDEHPMVQKAIGSWVRTAGDIDPEAMGAFLDKNLAALPAATISMIIEKMPAAEKQRWRDAKKAA
ncbi:DNA alkylation repair protein [Devosia sp. SD17-2]|uniref:DNA alkylation repair protein n=1 Tax=Devosia sp. SD17-2 TaxID=2976459 RepID=UPI0023D89360|nr:DNA alkylation repair protein [Devosia sp. SD17-2]WEJ35086.1 DNA alkylation repair protein [Devosia sp. SD17-2]